MNKLRLDQLPFLGLLLLLLLPLSACKTSKLGTDTKLKNRSSKYLMKQLIGNQVNAEWLDARTQVSFVANGQSQKATANIRWRKDSLLWMSLRKFGFEGVRVQITPDSIFMIDRLNRAYVAKDLGFINREFNLPASLSSLQALLLGNPVFFTTELSTRQEEFNYILEGKGSGTDTQYWINGLSFTLEKMIFADAEENRQLEYQLQDYRPSDDGNFSYFRSLNLSSPQTGVVELQLSFSDLEFNVPKAMRFEIPPSYKPME